MWTYKFIVNGSRPYRAECECYQRFVCGCRGSFSILLNWQNMTGRILELDDHLTNFASGTYSPATGLVMTPLNLPEADYGIIPPWETDFSFADGHFGYANNTGISCPTMDIRRCFLEYGYNLTFSLQDATLSMGAGGIDAVDHGDQCDGGVFESDHSGRLQRRRTS